MGLAFDEEFLVVTKAELKKARDAALKCAAGCRQVKCLGYISFSLRVYGRDVVRKGAEGLVQVLENKAAVEGVRNLGAMAFACCADAVELAEKALSESVREVLLTTSGGGPLAHDRAVKAAGAARLLLFDPEFSQIEPAYIEHVWVENKIPRGERLRSFLLGLGGEDIGEYWLGILRRAAGWRFDFKGVVDGIEKEWSLAVARGSEENLPEFLPEDLWILRYLNERPGVACSQVDIAVGASPITDKGTNPLSVFVPLSVFLWPVHC